MRSSKLLLSALIIIAIILSVCGCKKSVAEDGAESSTEKTVPYSIEEIEKKATDAGYICKRKEDAGIRTLSEDVNLLANGTLINCTEISSTSDHTRAIVFEFDSEQSAKDFCDSSEDLFGKLGEGVSKDHRGLLFIYGDTSVIENIW